MRFNKYIPSIIKKKFKVLWGLLGATGPEEVVEFTLYVNQGTSFTSYVNSGLSQTRYVDTSREYTIER